MLEKLSPMPIFWPSGAAKLKLPSPLSITAQISASV